jgi:O-antigen/teichoic acid export membrane protein
MKKYLSILDYQLVEIIRGASFAFIIKAFGALMNFGFSWLIAKRIGPEGTGLFYLSFTIILIASVISRFGLDYVAVKYTAANFAMDNWSAVKGLYRKTISMILITSLLITFCVIITAHWMAKNIFNDMELEYALRIMALCICPHALFCIHSEFLKGVKKIGISQFIQVTCLPSLAFIIIYLIPSKLGIQSIILLFFAAVIITALLGYLFWNMSIPNLSRFDSVFSNKLISNSCMPLFWMSLMNLIMLWAPILILGAYVSSSDVGVYSIAQRCSNLLIFVPMAIISIAAPKFAELYQQSEKEELSSAIKYSSRIMAFFSIPVSIIFIACSEVLMRLFGVAFIDGSLPLKILSVGQLLFSFCGIAGILLIMTGNEQTYRNITFVGVTINLLLCYILIPMYGTVGAAISTAVTIILNNFMATYIAYKKLGFICIPIGYRNTVLNLPKDS